MNTKKIGFIGGGNMASSLIGGLIASGYSASLLWVSDTNQQTLADLSSQLQVNTSVDNKALANQVDVIVLAVKPQILHTVATQIAPLLQNRNVLLVSIVAGISQKSLSDCLGKDVAIVRSMPNTPALVRTGATALHANDKVSEIQQALAETILTAVGIALWVDHESELDAVTAVSGSGPAYFFLLMEAMEQSALELGLSENTARTLIQQTALGAAKMALRSEETSKQLRQRITSPGGTTQEALQTFEKGRFIQLVSKALHAAHDRSVAMSVQLGGR